MDLISALVSFYGVIIVGYVSKKLKLFTPADAKPIINFVFYITYPLLVIYTISEMSLENLVETVSLIMILSLILHVFSFIVIFSFVKLFQLPRSEAGVALLTGTFMNSIFLPLPLALIGWGDLGIILVTFYAVVALVLFNFVGPIIGQKYSKESVELSFKHQLLEFLKFPPLMGTVIGLISLFSGFKFPTVALDFMRYLGDLTVPVILFTIGLKLEITFPKEHIKGILSVSLTRIVISPLFALMLLLFIPTTNAERGVFLLESLMPPAVANAAFAEVFRLDSEFTAKVVSVVTLFSIILVLFIFPLLV